MFVAFALPLFVICAIHTWLVFDRESKSANDGLMARADTGTSLLEPSGPNHTFENITDLFVALESQDGAAIESIRAWSTTFMRTSDAIGVALLNAHGSVIYKWPTELGIDFAHPDINAESVPNVYSLESSPSASALPDVAISMTLTPVDRGPELAPIAYVCVAFASPNVVATTVKQIVPLFLLLSLSAVITITVIQRSITSNVSAPLRSIALQASVLNPAGRIELEQYASLELEQIARSFGTLKNELHDSQRQTVALERRAESNAAEETKKIQRLLTRARKDAEHDSLTGLTNRRFIEERLEPIFQEQISQHVNVVIAMFDVDNFKPLNDTEGHAAGDQILRFFGELLRGSLRADDVGVRYGGDEFAAVLMGITDEQAHDICNRIVKMFNRQMSLMGIKTKVTLSSGFASRSATGAHSAKELLAQADAALYEAKRNGKGRVAEYKM